MLSDKTNTKSNSLIDPGYIENIISYLLRIGVILSSITVLSGFILLLFHRSDDFLSETYKISTSIHFKFPHSFSSVLKEASQLKGVAVIELGLLILLALPILRVGISPILFLLRKEYLMALITTIVFGVLIGSIIIAAITTH